MDSSSNARSHSSRPGRSSTTTPGKRTNVTMTQRNADRERELQRLKSLGVVSVLNKTFDMQDSTFLSPAPIPSPSSSTSSTAVTDHTILKPPSSEPSELSEDDYNRHINYYDATNKTQVDNNNNSNYTNNNDEKTRHGLRQKSSSDHHWVMTTLPPEQDEPRPSTNIHYDGYGNLSTSEISTLLKNSNDDNSNHNNDDDADYDDLKLYQVENHAALIDAYKSTRHVLQQLLYRLKESQKGQQLMEHSTKQTMETWLNEKEMESIKVKQLSEVVLKQDQMIHQLELALSSVLADNEDLRKLNNNSDNSDRSMTKDKSNHTNDNSENEITKKEKTRQGWSDLRQELQQLQSQKVDYEEKIVSLYSELESSQDEVRQLTLLSENLHQQCQQQQIAIDEKMTQLTKQSMNKDILIRKYRHLESMEQLGRATQQLSQQQEQIQHQRTDSQMDDVSTIHSILSSSSSNSTTTTNELDTTAMISTSSLISRPLGKITNKRSWNTMPQRKGKAAMNVLSWPGGYIPPPSGPPPSAPLPPLPPVDHDEHDDDDDEQVDPELNRMTQRHSTPSHQQQQKPNDPRFSSSLEMLLLQAPSGYILDDDTAMEQAYREFTEQLSSRLSISKEIDHLELWDHEALERLQQRHQQEKRQQQARPASLAPTTETSTSSKWSSSSDLDEKHHGRDNTAFWKGMKKKLRV
ncbi:uncharacterized protein BX664DRAFT_329509 [Halteromyces radiatus]|uniref:uncharacterized protein n=1 Tax=Halteromyces radiatus TaxID=101107 RepID=UPI00221F4240|nr:uncharacterized protein BX664DRAFT_329509 [Halteromyces radiatus]KAI8093358.1 hypothetical protein BX664DRAFT_329509 [Halteromyces radiatus]